LREPEDDKVRFVNLTLEDVIEVIRLSDQAHAEALHRRYCDFWLVDGELDLNAAQFGLPPKGTPSTPATAPEDAANPIPAATLPKRRVSRGMMKIPNATGPQCLFPKPTPCASEIVVGRLPPGTREPRGAEAPSAVRSFFHEDRTL
jgi:hypothetical protein